MIYFTFDQCILRFDLNDFHNWERDVYVLRVIDHMKKMHDEHDFVLMFYINSMK